jgi:hypothetical protein
MSKFKTTAAYVSGAICGHMWMPDSMAGIPDNHNLRAQFDRFSGGGATMRDALLHILMERGGDFQDARFSADTVIRVERRAVDAPGQYRLHVKERAIAELPGLSDLVHADAYTGDFCGSED